MRPLAVWELVSVAAETQSSVKRKASSERKGNPPFPESKGQAEEGGEGEETCCVGPLVKEKEETIAKGGGEISFLEGGRGLVRGEFYRRERGDH